MINYANLIKAHCITLGKIIKTLKMNLKSSMQMRN